MARKRKLHESGFKAKVAMAAVKDVETIQEIASRFGVHPSQVHQWKKQLLEGAAGVFSGGNGREKHVDQEVLVGKLYEQIGRLQVELDWLKKKATPDG
jgi:transposase-like protein